MVWKTGSAACQGDAERRYEEEEEVQEPRGGQAGCQPVSARRYQVSMRN